MQHLTEEQLIAHYYHDGDAVSAARMDRTMPPTAIAIESTHKVLALLEGRGVLFGNCNLQA